jgi:hypothetical protein
LITGHVVEFVPVRTIFAGIEQFTVLVKQRTSQVLRIVSVDTVLPVMIHGERTPNGFELILVEIIIEILFMKFFNGDFFFAMGKTAIDAVLALVDALKIGTILGLI